MTKETWYVCKDGMKFNDETKATAHEQALLAEESKQKDRDELVEKIKKAETDYTNLLKEYTKKYGTPTRCLFGCEFVDSVSDLAKAISDTIDSLFD